MKRAGDLIAAAAGALTAAGIEEPRREARLLLGFVLKDDANAKQAYSKVPSSSRRYRDAQRKIQ